MNISVLLKVLLVGIATLWLTGCSAGSSENIPTPIEGYNHTSAAINGFTVNGSGGPNIGPHQGGGSQMCCVSLPRKWRPGIKVVVEWEKDPNPGASRSWPQPRYSDAWRKAAMEHRSHYTRHRAIVEVEPYGNFGYMDVHFFPCDVVKVATSSALYGQPGYPHNESLRMKESKICP
ncbi:DUF3304 domain-containing protein [Pseudomonas aeruginosa]|uniref:DUF3304 domain-containing protein n=1 Tax=Pseudomonas aeruginosa TaxID=287 RepID=UPI00383BEE27